ncbi:MAG: GNAT family N-acetyltransferase [Clostridia bacterium]|nr:GNAT family N-acetyltransferase [Clostridia bacterium]
MRIETEHLIITDLTHDMAEAVHLNSLDEDVRRFVPDEVFETLETAREVVSDLIECYDTEDGPFVYAVVLKETGENIGYVQLVAIEDGWEIGYHIAKRYTKRGYASEALWAFLPAISKAHGLSEIIGICLAENRASVRVLEKCDFRQTYRGPGQYQGRERDIVRTLWTAPSTKEEIV